MNETSRHLASPELNATPLIDVLLVLLIMLIMTVPIATHVVELDLPRGTGAPAPQPVRLEILYRGEMFWNGQHVATLAELEPRFAALSAHADPPLLQVQPERFAPYERVAQVLAAARRSKVARISIAPVPDI